MRIVILDKADEAARFTADILIKKIQSKPDAVLGLATGSTMLPVYRELINAHRNSELSFAAVSTFNLDEYLGFAPDHPQSYRQFMKSRLFDLIDIDQSNTFVPRGDAKDPLQECRDYDRLIEEKGGIDIQLLGIGRNGHIGFNEPGSGFMSRTRIKTLAPATLEDNARFFGDNEFRPHLSITMGIGTILSARKVVLLASGEGKADAVRAAVEGPLTASCPGSALQLHANAVIVVDEAGAGKLEHGAFYKYAEAENRKLLESPGKA